MAQLYPKPATWPRKIGLERNRSIIAGRAKRRRRFSLSLLSHTVKCEQHFRLGFGWKSGYSNSMETATVIVEGGCQTVRLPKSVHLPATVFVRQDGDAVVLEPAKPKTWPKGFFESIHISDPAFERPE